VASTNPDPDREDITEEKPKISFVENTEEGHLNRWAKNCHPGWKAIAVEGPKKSSAISSYPSTATAIIREAFKEVPGYYNLVLDKLLDRPKPKPMLMVHIL
jgi:hypothetical protein